MEGLKGKKNVYMCRDCGHGFVSMDAEEGVTPFMTTCLNCDGNATSMFYKIPQEVLGSPAVLWVRPPKSEWPKFSQATIHHLEQGGLIRNDHKKVVARKKKAFRL